MHYSYCTIKKRLLTSGTSVRRRILHDSPYKEYLRFTSLVVCRFPVQVSVFVAINILTSVYFTLMCLKSNIMRWHEVAHAPGQSL